MYTDRQEVYPDRSIESICYDSVGRVASTLSPKGTRTTYAYYPDNQPESISTADLSPIQSTYDQTYGFLTKISQGSLSYAYSYKPVGAPGALRPSQISAPNGSISFSYDALDRVSSWNTANGTESYQFDMGGRISQVQNPLGTFCLSYLGATGQIAQMAYPNRTSENYLYLPNNQDRRLSALAFTGQSGNISSYGYQYNPVGTISRWSIQRDL
jgi:YD repeat-containing protein